MILGNYYKAFLPCVSWQDITLTNTSGKKSFTIFPTSKFAYRLVSGLMEGAKPGYTYGGDDLAFVVLGTGNEPPALSDYKLSGDIVTGFGSTVSFSGENAGDETYSQGTAVMTITNNNETDITIGEVGIVYQTGSSYSVLFERTVLESPITIPAGGVGQVTYTIRMNYPTA